MRATACVRPAIVIAAGAADQSSPKQGGCHQWFARRALYKRHPFSLAGSYRLDTEAQDIPFVGGFVCSLKLEKVSELSTLRVWFRRALPGVA